MKILLTTLNTKYIHSNLALKYMSKIAEDSGLCPETREFTVNWNISRIFTEIMRLDCDILCFSCYIWNIEKTADLCGDLKKAKPGTRILLGGPEVSFDAREFMEKHPWADFIIRGEGEYPFGEFCGKIAKGDWDFSQVPSLTYRKNGHIAENQECGPLPMEKVPFPYGNGFERDKIIYYESSRGCSYRCSYCLSSLEKEVRYLPMDRTLRELGYFLAENVRQIKFVDRTFNFNRERTCTIWKYLMDNDNGTTNFHFEIRGDLLDDRQIRLLSRARKGLFQFEIGVQSTNPDVLRAVNRQPATDRLFANIRKLKACGNIHLHVDLIAGLPLEDYSSFARSFDEAYSLGADNLQLGFLKVLKGTRLEREKEIHGMKFREKAPYDIIGNRYISPADLVKLRMIENVLELYSNRGGFSGSLGFLIRAFGGSPFVFYERFSKFFFESGFQYCFHKREDLYRIMLKFAGKAEETAGSAEEVKKLLEADLEQAMDFDAVKRFYKKGWDINGN